MTRIWKNLAAAGVFTLGLVVWGCEQATEPGQHTGPMEAEAPARLLDDGALDSDLADVAGLRSVRSTVAELESNVVRAVIGIEGGELELAGHVLTVPAGAVTALTQFSMTLIPNGGVEVHLQAIQPEVGNIGMSGFQIPVRLALSYVGTDVDDPEDLVIVRMQTGERLETELDEDGSSRVWAHLDHFSRYRLCSN